MECPAPSCTGAPALHADGAQGACAVGEGLAEPLLAGWAFGCDVLAHPASSRTILAPQATAVASLVMSALCQIRNDEVPHQA
jgi:hypothetical protein